MFRDTLRDIDEGESRSEASETPSDAEPLPEDSSDIGNLPDPDDLVLFLANGRPDPQYVFPPWTMPDDLDDADGNQVFYNEVTLNQITEHPLISERRQREKSAKKHRKPKKKKALAARKKQGQVPTLDLLRIWDTGASQGMVDRAVVSSKNAFKRQRSLH